MLTRRQLLGASALLSSLLLTGCGFHLRGSFTAPFEKLYIQGNFNNPLIVKLRQMIEAGSNVTVVGSPNEADAILELLSDTRTRDILALNDRGQAREYTLTRTVGFRMIAPDGYVYMKPTYFAENRSLAYSDSQFLSFGDESEKLYRDMQTDLCNQLLSVIESIKPRPAAGK